MKKLIATLLLVLALSTSGIAGDIPFPGAPAPPPPSGNSSLDYPSEIILLIVDALALP